MRHTAIALILAGAIGCQSYVKNAPTTYPVQGKLLVGASPVTKARVSFHPTDQTTQQEAICEVDKSGSFKPFSFGKEGLTPGKYKVSIEPRSYRNGRAESESPIRVPKRYWDKATSDLTVEVKDGPNDFTFDLK